MVDMNMKTCTLPDQCFEGSLNFGIAKTVIATKCCTTDLCNSKPAAGNFLRLFSEASLHFESLFSCENSHSVAWPKQSNMQLFKKLVVLVNPNLNNMFGTAAVKETRCTFQEKPVQGILL